MSLAGNLYQFWHSYGSDIQNGAVVLSAIAAFLIIRDGRRTAKRRGTLDLILHQESDRELIEAREAFTALRAGDTKLAIYGAKAKRAESQAQTIRKILNLHELVAVAIREGVVDECVYRRWFNKTFITDYEDVKDYITSVRREHDNPALFKEFEDAALRWRDDKIWYAPPSWLSRKARAAKQLWWA